MTAPRTYAFADLFEAVVDVDGVAGRDAVVIFGADDGGTGRRTYAELEEAANRVAHHLTALGVRRGDRVALYLENRPEYVELLLGAHKAGAVPVCVNFRYVAGELRHLLHDCGATVVVHEAHFASTLSVIRADLPALVHTLEMGPDYDRALAGSPSTRPSIERSGDDHYLIYTGGTTGLPRGVVWRQEDAFFACLGGGDPLRLHGVVSSPAEVLERIVSRYAAMLLAPLMHAAGSWVMLSSLLAGGKAVLPRGPLDPELAWQTAEDEEVNVITVIGDAVGRPMLDTWDAHPGRWSLPQLLSVANGGAPMSPTLKTRIAHALPSVVLVDGFGSSEAGVQGSARQSAADVDRAGGVAQFVPGDDTTVVLDDDDEPVAAGSGQAGRVARTGRLPLGYLGDPAKTAEVFVERDGARWLITGDRARVAADGTIELLGRDSAVINTGGEKVHAEEVEATLRAHADVYDVVVVGVPDERWGEVVAAVVQPVPGRTPTLEDLATHCRIHLAGYKVPRRLVTVERMQRSPAGKADLRWARGAAAVAGP